MSKKSLSWREQIDKWYPWARTGFDSKHAPHYDEVYQIRSLSRAVGISIGEIDPDKIKAIMEALCAVLTPYTKNSYETIRLAITLADADIIDPSKLLPIEDFTEIKGIGPRYAVILENVRADLANGIMKSIHIRISYQAYLQLKEIQKRWDMTRDDALMHMIGYIHTAGIDLSNT